MPQAQRQNRTLSAQTFRARNVIRSDLRSRRNPNWQLAEGDAYQRLPRLAPPPPPPRGPPRPPPPPRRLRSGFVHRDRAAIQLGAIQAFDRGAGFAVVAHRHEGKSARAAGVTVRDHRHFLDLTMGRELVLQRFLRCGKGKVANIQLHRAQLRNYELIPRSLGSDKGTKNSREEKEIDSPLSIAG